jgi:membrane protein implicated in regulation of membrane protease activity
MGDSHDSQLSDTALVVRWLIWAAFIIGAVAAVDAVGVSFWLRAAICAAVGVIAALVLRAFERVATRHSLWPN